MSQDTVDPPTKREVVMPINGMDDAVRRSSTEAQPEDSRKTRQVIYDSLNERRLQRERIIASLLLCPGSDTQAVEGPTS
jgi:hypothetical protein